MLFETRAFHHPKDVEHASEYEDAYCVGQHGIAAIADGVSQGIFCRQWADVLTRKVCESPPDVSSPEALTAWLANLRSNWRNSIDPAKLSWAQRQKLQQAGGAYSTLLWVSVSLLEASQDALQPQFQVVGKAIGDCCVFVVRQNKLLHKFPLKSAADFEADPATICSIDRKKDHLLTFHELNITCQANDRLYLCSDALGKWIYQELEVEKVPDWEALWTLADEAWPAMIAALRALPDGERMRVDDTTLVMLRLTPDYVIPADAVYDEAVTPGDESRTEALEVEVEARNVIDEAYAEPESLPLPALPPEELAAPTIEPTTPPKETGLTSLLWGWLGR